VQISGFGCVGDDDHMCGLSGVPHNASWFGGWRGFYSSERCQFGSSL
jgi:hypothetical protein